MTSNPGPNRSLPTRGSRSGDFFTLLTRAVRNDLDAGAFLKDVHDQLLAGQADHEPLRPDVSAAAHPEAIRQQRVHGRRDKADRKQARRAARRRHPTTTAPH
jgi:hypothetical protein